MKMKMETTMNQCFLGHPAARAMTAFVIYHRIYRESYLTRSHFGSSFSLWPVCPPLRFMPSIFWEPFSHDGFVARFRYSSSQPWASSSALAALRVQRLGAVGVPARWLGVVGVGSPSAGCRTHAVDHRAARAFGSRGAFGRPCMSTGA